MNRGRRNRSRPSLDRRYGFFRCKDCRSVWESSHVYCVSGTDKVYYKQECKKCKKAWNPYHIEKIKCAICGESGDDCLCTKEEKKERHVDMEKPHRSDLCEKCKAGYTCGYGQY